MKVLIANGEIWYIKQVKYLKYMWNNFNYNER